MGDYVKEAIQRYLSQLGGETPFNLYDMVIGEVEPPLIESVMQYVKGNQSKASRMLGLSRGTLRSKLQAHFGNHKPGKESPSE